MQALIIGVRSEGGLFISSGGLDYVNLQERNVKTPFRREKKKKMNASSPTRENIAYAYEGNYDRIAL